VHRSFGAAAPDRLWVTDITYVPTWSGFAYASFITDAFSRMIVGWRVAGHMRTDTVLDAIEIPNGEGGSEGELRRSRALTVTGDAVRTTASPGSNNADSLTSPISPASRSGARDLYRQVSVRYPHGSTLEETSKRC
jgi:hypothetical protein